MPAPSTIPSNGTPPSQHYPDGRQRLGGGFAPASTPSVRETTQKKKHSQGGRAQRKGSIFRHRCNNAMASAATWALSAPPRQLPAPPHCVGLPPQCRLQRAGASRHRTARSVVAMASGESFAATTATATTTTTTTTTRTATGETGATTSEEAPREGSTELPEIVKTIQQKWDKVEDKYAVASVAFAGLTALWTSTGVISAIDRLPLVPGVLELVGIGYTGWFIYQKVVFKPDREALIEKIKSTYDDITGSS